MAMKKRGKRRYKLSNKVYIVSNPTFEGLYKIGITSNIGRRLQQLNTAVPTPFTLEYLYKSESGVAKSIEGMFHNDFGECRSVNGEFFELDDNDFVEISLNALKYGCEILQCNKVWDEFLETLSGIIYEYGSEYQKSLAIARSTYGLDYDESVPDNLILDDYGETVSELIPYDTLCERLDSFYGVYPNERVLYSLLEKQGLENLVEWETELDELEVDDSEV